MRLDCTFWVESRDKPTGRQTKGCLSIGCERKKSGESVKKTCYLLLTSKSNNHPRKFEHIEIKLSNEGLYVCGTRRRDGMATLQFREPGMRVFISQADPVKLATFLYHLDAVAASKLEEALFSKIQPLEEAQRRSCQSVNMKTLSNLCIDSRAEYAALRSFPTTLQRLHIVGIGLRAVDIRWFSALKLQKLELGGNQLGREWTAMHWRRFAAVAKLTQLHTLDLSSNAFTHFPDLFMDALPHSLVNLNLGSNRLTKLSNRISRLQNLVKLTLDANPMEELPEDLCLLARLRELSLTGMHELRFFPVALLFISPSSARFNTLDVSGCARLKRQPEGEAAEAHAESAPATLCALSAAALLNNGDLVEPGSRLLRAKVADCLPAMLRAHARAWLHRCCYCACLYAPNTLAATHGLFQRIELRMFTTLLCGSSSAWVQALSCARCRSRLYAKISGPYHF